MGWGTDFNTNIYLSRQIFNGKADVEDKIDELEREVNNSKSMLKMFAASTPNDIVPEEWEDSPLDWIHNQMNEIFDTLQEDIINIYKLELYLEYLEENPIAKNEI